MRFDSDNTAEGMKDRFIGISRRCRGESDTGGDSAGVGVAVFGSLPDIDLMYKVS